MVEQPEGRIPTLLASLTTGEIAVLQSAADGISNKEIGEMLILATSSIERRFASIYEKLGLATDMTPKSRGGSRAKAVADGFRLGLIK